MSAKILFVCVSNICRSVALEAVLKNKTDLACDSCGIGWYFLGEDPDPRTLASLKKRGITIEHKAQKFQERFFQEFDLILAVTVDVKEHILGMAKTDADRKKVHLATEFSEKYKGEEIPDPYYSEDKGFDQVLDMAEDIAENLKKSFS